LESLKATDFSSGSKAEQIKNMRGSGSRVLFDKKVFLNLLLELEHMRMIKSVKKRYYLFHEEYQGKPKERDEWHREVENLTTTNLKFLNVTRLLKIIGYDPIQYMNMETLKEKRSYSQYRRRFSSSAGLKVKIDENTNQPRRSTKRGPKPSNTVSGQDMYG
jgi:hypothetical protein